MYVSYTIICHPPPHPHTHVRAHTSIQPTLPLFQTHTHTHTEPDGSPVEIQLFPQLSNPRSLQVTWGEVPRSVRNGVITKYDIMYQPLENYDGEIGTGSVSTTAVRMVTLSGLEEDTEYNVSIRAHTVVGEGPFSEAFTGRTSEGSE